MIRLIAIALALLALSNGVTGWYSYDAGQQRERDRQAAANAADFAREARSAVQAATALVQAGSDFAAQIQPIQVRTRTIVQQVHDDVTHSPSLAGCTVPADVLRLRAEQVAQSQRLAGPAAVPR